ncbi:DUF3515 domain-containing protein [Brevibacterium album]|uniref:DUF3515 domain-containing protein n=1 Tax=Brevibacterium album TaxID=417948 RepID=UPI00041EA6B5|nr:DUF3515 domain-containing protein [Brevibacterium album]
MVRRSASARSHARPAARWTALALIAATLGLTGCARMLVVEPAENAQDPDCALPTLMMPDTVGDLEKRTTSAQAATAWGDPASVIARCGVPEPAPTTDPCVTVDGVDWVQVRDDEETWQFVTYGRSPAVEVLVSPQEVSGATALAAVSSAVERIEQTSQCVAAEDADQVEGEVPSQPQG